MAKKDNRGKRQAVDAEVIGDAAPLTWWQHLAGTVGDAGTAQVMISDWQAYVVAGMQAGRDPAEAVMNADLAMQSHMERQLALTEGMPPTPEEQAAAAAAELAAGNAPADVQ